MISQNELNKKVEELWQKFRPAIVSRLEAVGNAVDLLQRGKLTDDSRKEAAAQAHKLAGSLGTFGMQGGSESANEIESLFTDNVFGKIEIERIVGCFERMKREIQGR